jgi:hypothetical protein
MEVVLKQQDGKVFWHKTEGIINGMRRLHKYELDHLSFPVKIIKIMKKRRMGQGGTSSTHGGRMSKT